MLKCPIFTLLMLPAFGHVVSMSTGEARLNGPRLDYELRMPLYEAVHLSDPERELFANISFYSDATPARLLEHHCRSEADSLVCTGLYLFEREVDAFDVRCTFSSVTVPNHVHLLRAVRGDKSDQAAFDASFTEATVRFRPPTIWDTAARDASAGFWRAIAGLAQLLFLAALVLAARSRRELAILMAMFAAGQVLAVAAQINLRLALSPRFVEAAAALTVAYLAIEILLLPRAGQRWAVVAILGLLHGVYFSMLISAGDYGRVAFLAGAVSAEMVLVFAVAAIGHLTSRFQLVKSTLVERGLASVLFLLGIVWFGLRLRS